MKRRQFIAGLPLLACTTGFAEENKELKGVYELVVSPKGDGPTSTKYLLMQQAGPYLRVKDLATGKQYQGSVKAEKVYFAMQLRDVGGGSVVQTHHLYGAISQNGVIGQLEAGGSKIEWMANRLTVLWLCSNHQPTHIAKTKEDMIEYTEKEKCVGWHKVRPETLG